MRASECIRLCIVSHKRVDCRKRRERINACCGATTIKKGNKRSNLDTDINIIDTDVKQQLTMQECGCAVIRTENYASERVHVFVYCKSQKG